MLSWLLLFIDRVNVAQISFIELGISSERSERSSRKLWFGRLAFRDMISHLWLLSKAFLHSPVQLNDALLGASEVATINYVCNSVRESYLP